MKSEDDCFFWWQESYDKPRQCVEKQRHYSANKGPYSQGYGLPSGHVRLWELDYKEGRTPKNWCLWTVVLEKTPESLLNSKEMGLVNFKGDQPWILAGRTDAEAEAPVFGHLMQTADSLEKSLMLAKTEGRRRRGHQEDEMAGQHRWWSKHELGQTLGDGEGQRGLMCCSPSGFKESDMTRRLNNSNKNTSTVSFYIFNHFPDL